jgi:hypothetical protein
MSEMTQTTNASTILHRHPVRAFFWSIPFALGIVLILIVTKTIELSLVTMIVIFVVLMVLGTLWGAFGPARKPKGPPPAAAPVRAESDATRFDEFTDTVDRSGGSTAADDDDSGAGDSAAGDSGADGGDD